MAQKTLDQKSQFCGFVLFDRKGESHHDAQLNANGCCSEHGDSTGSPYTLAKFLDEEMINEKTRKKREKRLKLTHVHFCKMKAGEFQNRLLDKERRRRGNRI